MLVRLGGHLLYAFEQQTLVQVTKADAISESRVKRDVLLPLVYDSATDETQKRKPQDECWKLETETLMPNPSNIHTSQSVRRKDRYRKDKHINRFLSIQVLSNARQSKAARRMLPTLLSLYLQNEPTSPSQRFTVYASRATKALLAFLWDPGLNQTIYTRLRILCACVVRGMSA